LCQKIRVVRLFIPYYLQRSKRAFDRNAGKAKALRLQGFSRVPFVCLNQKINNRSKSICCIFSGSIPRLKIAEIFARLSDGLRVPLL